jgi:PhnB protein
MQEITPYLIFNGNCREAMKFYEKCLGGQLHMMQFSESPEGKIPKEAENKIMHARLTKGTAILMASDNMPGMPFQQGDNVFITIKCESAEEAEKLFAAIGEKGQIKMPIQETFWAVRFGMLTDQFGINWMINFEKPQP